MELLWDASKGFLSFSLKDSNLELREDSEFEVQLKLISDFVLEDEKTLILSVCFFRWCCMSLALLAYCLWHQLQKCGFIVMLPTVAEKVLVETPLGLPLFRFEGGSDLPLIKKMM